MGSKRILAVLLVALVSVPSLADASLPKDLKAELQGYADTNKQTEDAEATQAALLTLGRIGDKDAKAAIKEFEEADDKRVALTAHIAAWMAGDRRADDTLVEKLKEDAQLYLTLRDVISVLPDDKEQSLVAQLVKEVDDAKKRDVFRYLAQQHGDLYAMLEDYLVNRDAKERAAAVEATLFTARDAAGDFAQKMVDSKRDEIRASGVELAKGLSRRPGGMKKAVEVLENALGKTSDEAADKIARYLVTLDSKKGVAHLIDNLEKAEEDEERQDIAEYLLEHEATVSAEVAKPLMESENQTIKSLGFQLAATSADKAFVGKLSEMFGSTHFDQRVIAVKALGYTDSQDAVRILSRALFEGNSDLRLHAAKGLGRIAHPQGLDALQKALNGERDRQIKLAVIDAVSRIEGKKSLNMLRFQSTSRDPQIRLAIVKAIRRLGHADGVNALKVVEQDRNLDVKWQAFLTALELDPKQGLARMRQALRNPPEGFMTDIEALDADTRNKVVAYLLLNGSDAARASAMSTARRSGDAMLDIYRELVTNSETPDNVRRMAFSALADRRDDKDKPLFEKLIKSDSKQLQHGAAWVLTNYGSKDLEATFRGMLGNEDPALKSIGAYGLATVND